jgi:3-hydroxyisobutyrate dehydrogenase-like beta-hydroxyacid dehydrogenase
MATRVGFIGLGRIGKPIAASILAAGFDLMVYDVRAEPVRELTQLGAKRADALSALREHAEIIVLAIVDNAQVEEIVFGEGGLLARCWVPASLSSSCTA